MERRLFNALIVSLTFSCGALGCQKADKKDQSSTEAAGEALGASMALEIWKEQYKEAKDSYDKGEENGGVNCISDTTALRSAKSAEAQKLADDFDRLCQVDFPARTEGKELDKDLADVKKAKTDKDYAEMLKFQQVALGSACDHAKSTLQTIREKKLADLPNAKTFDAKVSATCTPDNLEGGPGKTASKATAKK